MRRISRTGQRSNGRNTITAASCSSTERADDVSVAVNGDTALVPAGSCTWTTRVRSPNTTGITLQGAGLDTTTIVDGVSTEIVLDLDVAAWTRSPLVTPRPFL